MAPEEDEAAALVCSGATDTEALVAGGVAAQITSLQTLENAVAAATHSGDRESDDASRESANN